MLTLFKPVRLVCVAALVLLCARAASAVEPDRFISPKAESVVSLNVRQTMDSPLVKKYALDLIRGVVEANPDIQNLAKAAGLDVTKDIDSVLVTTETGADAMKILVVVRGKFDVTKFEAALAQQAKSNPKALKITREGDATVYEAANDGTRTFAAFADAKTIVASSDRAHLLAALKSNGNQAPKPRPELAEALKKISGNESLYLAMVMTPELRKSLEKNDQTKELAKVFVSLSGAVTVTDTIQIDLSATTTDPASAKKFADFANTIKNALPALAKAADNEKLVPLAETIQKSAKVGSQGTGASLSLKLTEDVIKNAAGK
jgi:hypothetical protein